MIENDQSLLKTDQTPSSHFSWSEAQDSTGRWITIKTAIKPTLKD